MTGHFSTDAPALQLSLESTTNHRFEPLQYGNESELTAAPAGEYQLILEPSGAFGKASAAVTQVVDLTNDAGEVVTLLAAGFLDPAENRDGPGLSITRSRLMVRCLGFRRAHRRG